MNQANKKIIFGLLLVVCNFLQASDPYEYDPATRWFKSVEGHGPGYDHEGSVAAYYWVKIIELQLNDRLDEATKNKLSYYKNQYELMSGGSDCEVRIAESIVRRRQEEEVIRIQEEEYAWMTIIGSV